MRGLKAAGRLLSRLLSAAAGIAAAVWLFTSFMVVEAGGSAVMPEIMPGQKVLVALYDRDNAAGRDSLTTGDIIVYEAPFYDIDGEGRYLIRRVTGVRNRWIEVDRENAPADPASIIGKEQVLGKVIKIWERRNAS